jgi:AcrR family transcriptional regulator
MGRKTRARAPEKKEAQYQIIIETAKEMYKSSDFQTISMNSIAKRLNMEQSNLYNYFKSKRELWIAVRANYREELDKKISIITQNHNGKNLELVYKLINAIMDLMGNDFSMFLFLFVAQIPPSKSKGPIEENYFYKHGFFDFKKTIQTAIENGEIQLDNIDLFTYQLWSMMFGAMKAERHLKFKAKVIDPINNGNKKLIQIETYRAYALQTIKDFIFKNATYEPTL